MRQDYTKVAINGCYGGFGLSHEAMLLYFKLRQIAVYPEKHSGFYMYWLSPPTGNQDMDDCWEGLSARDIQRTDPVLIQVLEDMGTAANGQFARIEIAEILVGMRYRIQEYDGMESIETESSIDWDVA